jgi:hypothetical protein
VLEVGENMTLYDFAKVIVRSFSFDFDHAFGFSSNLDHFYKPAEKLFELFADLENVEQTPGSKGVKRYFVSDAFEKKGDKMLFLFDYGDDWQFDVSCLDNSEKIHSASRKYYKLIESHGDDPEQYPDYVE